MIVHNVERGQLAEDVETLAELEGILEEPDSVDKHKKLVRIAADDYNSWNILKKHLEADPGDFESQLEVTERALEAKTKSYQAWHHRKYMMRRCGELYRGDERAGTLYEKYLKRDDYLTSVLLKVDPRNFHCWNYRMELFGSKKGEVDCDVYNYSYLHHSNSHDPLALVFADPENSAGWEYFYVCREADRLRSGAYIRAFSDRIELRFKEAVCGRVTLKLDGREMVTDQDIPTRFMRLPLFHSFATAEVETAGLRARLEQTTERREFLDKILSHAPGSVGALSVLLDHTRECECRKSIVARLCRLDAVRSNFYNSLANEFYTVYA
jgi:geranylgeranyl transferase type-2 subunit alpha